jgi:isopropylmalate/homocitrate/citramalate synthase
MHREFKLRKSKKEILKEIAEEVAYARLLFKRDVDSIMFSPED